VPEGRPKIAIAHAAFLGGGGEAVTLWGIQAAAVTYDVTLITLLPIDLNAIDNFYGTSLRSAKFRVVSLMQPNGITRKLASGGWLFTLRQQLLSWHVRRLSGEFDLVISTFNEMDIGRPGVQYIHAPLFSAYNSEARRILRFPDSLVRRAWKYVCGLMFGASERRLRENLSVTNSEWTATLLGNTCQIPARVLYPPVRPAQVATDWAERRDGFLCVARFVRDKRLELAIQVVERVRAKGFDVGLHIVGHVGDQQYFSVLLEMQKSRSSWLTFDQDISRYAFTELLQQYKYGIHPREAEQFGIGVAEMAASGCIPFVPSVGGQAEIVGSDSRLVFDGVDDAAEKIARVLSSRELQDSVRGKMSNLAEKFSVARFMEDFRQLIDEGLKTRITTADDTRSAEAIVE
jgi:glycosyltransferase involved in cell wall biosynthesis